MRFTRPKRQDAAMMKPPRFPKIAAEVDGHRLSLAITGADRRAAILKLVNEARHRLRLFYYIFGDDEISTEVREALIDARNRGVEVTLLVDSFGTSDKPDSVYADFVDAGICFARFHSTWGRRYLLRNHQKIIVADEKRALVGGTNINDAYFGDAPDGSSWHDLCLTIEGAAVKRLAAYFDDLKAWMLGERKSLRTLVQILKQHSDGQGSIRWLMGGPFQRLSPLTHTINVDLNRAKRLDMIHAYFSPNWGMLRRIGRIVTRNKGHARVITAGRSDSLTTMFAARHCYRRLLKSGVEVAEFLPQLLHMKLIVVDNIVYIGSANFDMRSLYMNTEIMVRIEDKGLAEQMRAFVEAHAPYLDLITRAEHHNRSSWWNRARWLLAYFFVSTVDSSVTRGLAVPGR